MISITISGPGGTLTQLAKEIAKLVADRGIISFDSNFELTELNDFAIELNRNVVPTMYKGVNIKVLNQPWGG